jgi:hypothetical protein
VAPWATPFSPDHAAAGRGAAMFSPLVGPAEPNNRCSRCPPQPRHCQRTCQSAAAASA